MSAAPVAHYLVEFGGGSSGTPPALRREVASVFMRSPAEEMAERLAEATARGREEGRAAAQAEADLAVAAERRRGDELLASERARWSRDEGSRLADLLGAGLSAIEEGIARSAAGILTPFLEAGRRDEVMRELADAVSTLLRPSDAALLRVEGPGDLLAGLRDRLGARADLCEFRTSDRPDIALLCGETVIETRLRDWADRIVEARNG